MIRSLKFQKLTLINHQVWQWVETQFPWDKIRGLGNSPIAKITGLIPVLGSILVFNYSFLAFLTFTELTSIPLVRIHLIYYGACLIGVASVVYALFCPTRIKKYIGLVEYTSAELSFLSFEGHKEWYRDHARDEYNRLSGEGQRHTHELAVLRTELSEDNINVPRLMAAHYHALNHSYPRTRKVTCGLYAFGFFLILSSTLWTFSQVTYLLGFGVR